MGTHNVKIHLDKYICQPYRPEMAYLIEIQTKSGTNKCRTDKTRRDALLGYLERLKMTEEDYRQLEIAAKAPWYLNAEGIIFIPRHQLAGMLVETSKRINKSAIGTKFEPDNLRSEIVISDFVTELLPTAAKLYSRYVRNEKTNMRRLQEDPYVENFDATGTVELTTEVKPDHAKALITQGLKKIGLGSARKMGYGRGEMVSFS